MTTDPIAEARERGAREALDAAKDALHWRWAEIHQNRDWMQRAPDARDPHGIRRTQLLEQSSTLMRAIEDLYYLRYPGAWDREREYMRKAFERGEV